MSYEKSERPISQDLKLLQSAQSAVSRNLTPYQISHSLRGMDTNHLQKFFFYYALFKKGTMTDENYQNTVKEFKDEYDKEMVKKWSRSFQDDMGNLIQKDVGELETTQYKP